MANQASLQYLPTLFRPALQRSDFLDKPLPRLKPLLDMPQQCR